MASISVSDSDSNLISVLDLDFEWVSVRFCVQFHVLIRWFWFRFHSSRLLLSVENGQPIARTRFGVVRSIYLPAGSNLFFQWVRNLRLLVVSPKDV